MDMKAELYEVDGDTYSRLLDKRGPIFCSSNFLELNKYKVDKVHYFILKDGKIRLAFAMGEKDGVWLAPFSAPFATVIELKKYVELDYYYVLFDVIIKYVKANKGTRIEYYSQPDIYGRQQNAKAVNALLGCGFEIDYQEVNYSFDLEEIRELGYESLLHHNARKNLKTALKGNMEFKQCVSESEKKRAYDVIEKNRRENNYYLSMTWKEVVDTTQVVENDFFIITRDNIDIASAMIFHVTEDIVQVVYWGDIQGESEYRPINYLAYKIVEYYLQDRNIKAIDIGPSAPKGIPNLGLCSFKESIGCSVSSKYRYIYEFKD